MKKQLLLLSMVCIASGLYGYEVACIPKAKLSPLMRGLKILSWPLKPFARVNDATKKSVKKDIHDNWSEICKGHTQEKWDALFGETDEHGIDKQEKANYKRFRFEEANGNIEDKHVFIYWYNYKCLGIRKILTFLHCKPYTYVASGIWYVVLAAGTARGVQKVAKYFKKRNKKKRKEQKRQEALLADSAGAMPA